MTLLSPSNLETNTYNQGEWQAIYNKNIDYLNGILLKIQALQDVKIDKLVDGSVLMWDASLSKWRLIYYP